MNILGILTTVLLVTAQTPGPRSTTGAGRSGPDPLLGVRTPVCDAQSPHAALMIIDMQDGFALRRKFGNRPGNAAAVARVLGEQTRAIALARRAGAPIIFVEYVRPGNPYGSTNAALRDAVAGYGRATTVRKTTDAVFDPNNAFKGEVARALTEHRVGTLVMAGANGGSCVLWSAVQALSSNCRVVAFGAGIADFNFEAFVTPYAFGSRQRNQIRTAERGCVGCGFAEAAELADLRPHFPSAPTPSPMTDDSSAVTH